MINKIVDSSNNLYGIIPLIKIEDYTNDKLRVLTIPNAKWCICNNS